jgi:hypothetical protein
MAARDRRAELLGWIADTRRLQLRMGFGLIIAFVAALVALAFSSTFAKLALAFIAIVAVCAFWVTGSHILDWRNRLEALEQAERQKRAGR